MIRQLFGYYGVSIMQTFVEFGVFALLQLAGAPFRIANTAAVFCSGSFNYAMNRSITFKSSSNHIRSIAMFTAMYCWNLLFSNLMMSWIPSQLGWPTMAVKIITMGMQSIWGFLLCRHVIFA
ncbi:GtrA family protein [uncultured Bifidobacterium sp.]|uniref:GtrA family protein n=1 Tax=uncultured Bifidobacterium sp. TaxID=165187 RepID=UPI00260D2ADD|nr:GtrA family protein [uncultured Bifidobacterium sp.]